jgi:hypothetical protein
MGWFDGKTRAWSDHPYPSFVVWGAVGRVQGGRVEPAREIGAWRLSGGSHALQTRSYILDYIPKLRSAFLVEVYAYAWISTNSHAPPKLYSDAVPDIPVLFLKNL